MSSTALCLLLQYLEPKKTAVEFLNTIWVLNHLSGKRKAVINMLCAKNMKVREAKAVDGDNDREIREAKDHFRIQKDIQEGIKEDMVANGKKGHMQEKQGKEDTDTNTNKENTQNRKKVKEDEKDILTDEDKGHTTKIIRKSTKATKSLTWEDVSMAIDTAERGDEGWKLMRRNFEGMEGSYSCTLLLQGVLNGGKKWLLHENKEGYGGKAFLYSLHPLLLKLCGGGAAQHTFQAFQVCI